MDRGTENGILRGFICHSRKERCLKVFDRRMPICARCFGFYTGILLGSFFTFLFHLFFAPIQSLPSIVILATLIATIAFIIDGSIQEITDWESRNWIRLTTGGSLGIFIGIDIFWILLEVVL